MRGLLHPLAACLRGDVVLFNCDGKFKPIFVAAHHFSKFSRKPTSVLFSTINPPLVL